MADERDSYTRRVLVLVPVKAFGRAKLRLAEVLDGPARAALAREMADRVLTAAAPLPVAVICDDDAVAAWAESRGARVLWRPGHGLNGAVNDAVATVADEGVDRILVTHADLPLATGFDEVLAGRRRRASSSSPTATRTGPTWPSCPRPPASRSPTGRAPSPPTGRRPSASACRSGSSARPA